jgi:hypothetical protein
MSVYRRICVIRSIRGGVGRKHLLERLDWMRGGRQLFLMIVMQLAYRFQGRVLMYEYVLHFIFRFSTYQRDVTGMGCVEVRPQLPIHGFQINHSYSRV